MLYSIMMRGKPFYQPTSVTFYLHAMPTDRHLDDAQIVVIVVGNKPSQNFTDLRQFLRHSFTVSISSWFVFEIN
jgi:hypothetical protein